MKRFLGYILKKAGLYNKLRYSRLFDAYEKKFRPDRVDEAKREIDFYRSFLSPCRLIFDIGAFDGHKTEAFLHISEKVVCCEPDRKNFSLLRDRFRARKDRVALENLALGENAGVMDMYVHHEGSAFNTLNPKFKSVLETDQKQKWNEKVRFRTVEQVFITTLDELIAKYGRPDFIKIDTEGSELLVLKGLSQPVDFISVECLLPDFRSELELIFDHLQQLDKRCTFNIAVRESLLFDLFHPRQFFAPFLDVTTEHHFELIVKMESAAAGNKPTPANT